MPPRAAQKNLSTRTSSKISSKSPCKQPQKGVNERKSNASAAMEISSESTAVGVVGEGKEVVVSKKGIENPEVGKFNVDGGTGENRVVEAMDSKGRDKTKVVIAIEDEKREGKKESETSRENSEDINEINVLEGEERHEENEKEDEGKEIIVQEEEENHEENENTDTVKEIILQEGKEKQGEGNDHENENREKSIPVKEHRKRKEYEVFVGGLDRYAVEEDLETVFSKVGEVVEVRLVRKPHSQKNKGFAFVRFATVEQAKRAASELSRVRVKGRVCGVLRSNDNETLHLRNICPTWNKEKLMEKLKSYDLENLEDVHLIEDPSNKGKNRGYAFLDFTTHMDAVAACNKMQKGDFFFGTDIKAEVSFTISVEPDEEIMAQVKSIFVDGLPTSWDENHVREQFKKFGEIESVQLARNMATAKRKDFGFVSFTTREAAMACIEEVNKNGVQDGQKTVMVKASLRKPLSRRLPPMMHKAQVGRGLRPYEIRGSQFGGGSGYREWAGKGSDDRYGGRYPFVEDEYGVDVTPRATHFERGRSRSSYWEGSSTGKQYSRNYRDHTYSHQPSNVMYRNEIYDDGFDFYDTHPVSGVKRSFSSLDGDLAPSSLRYSRSRLGFEMDDYPAPGASSFYDDYLRSTRDSLYSYSGMGYDTRYLSGSSSRSRF